ncbi:Transcription factor grauzone [Pseudolycoriella hygida]|uniref:Transcription factor grauzone n=1 Tax=Pseudolycoriella hygida TaxID=35572 RepID=A0A9Q0MKU9_9DIPT|nr:Transcription factor grauzone [Pseudolycoriella hygida]
MDINSTLLCRLCMQESEDVVNTFDKFENTTVGSVLEQHFCFQIKADVGLSTFLCQICWSNTRTFHIFYEQVKMLREDYWKSVKAADYNAGIDFIEEEPGDTEVQLDLNLVKSEESLVESVDVIVEVKKEEETLDLNNYDNSEETSRNGDKGPTGSKKRKNNETEALIGEKPEREKNQKGSNYFESQLRIYFNMKCDICGDPFETYRSAQKHYRNAHKVEGYLICCGKKFHRRDRVMNHIKYHLNPSKFSCDQCGRKFFRKSTLATHIENHEPMSSRAFKCDLCPKSFPRETALIIHKNFVHLPVKCVECDMTYPSKSKLLTHIKNVHTPKIAATRVCDICGQDFANKYSLLVHMQGKHSAIESRKFQCNIWLKHQSTLSTHMKKHQESAPVKCSVCGKVTRSKFALNNHMKYVHGERKYQCSICCKSFKKSLTLKEHMAGHTGEDLYKCPYCTRTFKSSANMFSHRKKMHLAECFEDCEKKRSLLKQSSIK